MEELAPGVNRETSFLNQMKYGDVYRVTLAPYVHANFGVMLSQRLLPESGYGNYDKDELSAANAWMERYVHHFLDAYLKGDAVGRSFLDLPAARTGAPAHLLTVYRSKSQGPPPTRTAFAAELARLGFDHAASVYREFRKRDSSFTVSEDDLNAWGYKLLGAGDARSSVAILRLTTDLFPDSGNAFDSLGEAYAANGDKALAIAAYRKSLALNPDNENAVARLARLGAPKR